MVLPKGAMSRTLVPAIASRQDMANAALEAALMKA
jgi:hypothetical protein